MIFQLCRTDLSDRRCRTPRSHRIGLRWLLTGLCGLLSALAVQGQNIEGEWEDGEGQEYHFLIVEGQMELRLPRHPERSDLVFVGKEAFPRYDLVARVTAPEQLEGELPLPVRQQILQDHPELDLTYRVVRWDLESITLEQVENDVVYDRKTDELLEFEIGRSTKTLQLKRRQRVDIAMDLDLDGDVDAADEALEDTHSAFVVRDYRDLYSDPVSPARYRKLVVQKNERGRDPVILIRSRDNLRLFDNEDPAIAEEIPFENDRVQLSAGTYWVRGGSQASTRVGDVQLRAVLPQQQAQRDDSQDELKVTVFWVLLRPARNSDEMLKGAANQSAPMIQRIQGHDLLGVRRSAKDSDDTELMVRGLAELQGLVQPSGTASAMGRRFGVSADPEGDLAVGKRWRATQDRRRPRVQFGFVFRRTAEFRTYAEMGTLILQSPRPVVDDSHIFFQDLVPGPHDGHSIIIDNDAPGLPLSPLPDDPTDPSTDAVFLRANFVEWVVFQTSPDGPYERVSNRMNWAVSLDVWRGADEKAVVIRDRPNDGQGTNEVLREGHLPSLDLGMTEKERPTITRAQGSHGNGVIRSGETLVLELTGTNLFGRLALVRQELDGTWGTPQFLDHQSLWLEHDGKSHYSPATRAWARLQIHGTVGSRVGFRLFNGGGASEVFGTWVVEEKKE